jgi:hypothetical protein
VEQPLKRQQSLNWRRITVLVLVAVALMAVFGAVIVLTQRI